MISTPIELNEVELVDQFNNTNIQSGKQYLSLILNSKVPNHLNWIVKMWHFGKNSLTGYSGEKFEIKWGDILNVFHLLCCMIPRLIVMTYSFLSKNM